MIVYCAPGLFKEYKSWRVSSSGMWRRVVCWDATDVLEEHIASIWNFLRPWRWRRYVPPKRRLHLNRLHGVTSQKMILFIITSVKTSNPKYKSSPRRHEIPRPTSLMKPLRFIPVFAIPCHWPLSWYVWIQSNPHNLIRSTLILSSHP
jgi:hypothetical protein